MSTLTQKTKQELGERIIEIGRPDFVRRRLCRFLPGCPDGSVRPEDVEAITIQNDGTGAATVEFRTGGDAGLSAGLFGKLYHDDSGAHAHAVLTALWEGGFGPTHRYQVPEPLCFMADHNLLIMRKAGGTRLDSLLARDPEAAAAGVKEAARWLLCLHESSVRLGRSDRLWYLLGKLSDRLAKAASSHPGETGRLIEMLDRLSEVEAHGPSEEVQVHGQFRPIHVFLGDETISVIDLDRSQPSDPAQDLAEFVHRLRTTLYRALGRTDQANILTEIFLNEYGAARPSALERVSFYRGFHILASLCRHMIRLKEDDPQWKATVDFYSREFEDALSGFRISDLGLRSAVRSEGFQSRASEIMRPGFVGETVYPAVFGKPCDENRPLLFEASVSQEDRGTGRVSVRYRLGTDVLVYGKLYPPSVEPRSLAVMQGLRAAGFADGAYQVAEPLAWLPERNFLLTRAAQGIPLVDVMGEQGPPAIEDVRRAARWLVRLHTSPVRIGPPQTLWISMKLFTIMRRLAKAAAARPHERNRLTQRIHALCLAARSNAARPPVVQTHGRFHYEHIYVSEEAVTVIDLDQSYPSDPARDLAEFMTMLRRRTFKRTGSLAATREPGRAFLNEYRAHLPGNMPNLAVWWGAAILLDLFRFMKKDAADERVGRVIGFFEEEYDSVISGRLLRELME